METQEHVILIPFPWYLYFVNYGAHSASFALRNLVIMETAHIGIFPWLN